MSNTIDEYLITYEESLNKGIPGIYQIYQSAHLAFINGDLKKAKKLENLIYLLHNSIVYAECELGKDVRFAYGGIGVVVHKDAEILEGVMIGQGVTRGGASGKFRISSNNKRLYTPFIGKHVYIAAGFRVLGGIVVGNYSIIGANTVVTKDIPPFTVVAKNPSQIVNTITPKNCLRYKNL